MFTCLRLPFSQGVMPGRVLEEALANVRSGEVLHTYDFVDVVCREEACGWQVKSTRDSTLVTWKRAKLPNATDLVDESLKSHAACQELGNVIINFCNEHAQRSLADYGLQEIGYARLILHRGGRVTYFEKSLCSTSQPIVFDPKDFLWSWPTPKAPGKKEQLRLCTAYIDGPIGDGGRGTGWGRINSTSAASLRGGRPATTMRSRLTCHPLRNC